MNSIVRVVVNIPGLRNLYDYEVPESIGTIQKGSLIVVPFGNLRAQAVVVEENCTSVIGNLKQVSGVLDAEAVLTPQQMQLATWVAENYAAAISDCVHLVLPAGMNQLADVLYSNKKDICRRGSAIFFTE